MIYFDQKVDVTADDDGEVRVSFSHITLVLSDTEASWLSSNLLRAIRERERKAIATAVSLTVEAKRLLRPGDRVVVRDDCGHSDIYDVTSPPWQLGHGAWVIGLKGISGGYSLDRVIGIVSTSASRGPELKEV